MSRSRLSSVLQAVRRATGEPTREQTDGQLLRRFAAEKDEAAYTELMRRHGDMVLRVCRRVLHNATDADDAFQATFLTLVRKALSVRKERSLASWLHGVAHRTALRVRDAAARRRTNEAKAPGRATPDPLDEITVREAQAIFDAELAGLPDRLRAPLVLCYLESKTQDEAARELGWSLATLRRRVAQGREALGARLALRGLTLGAVLSVGLLVPAGAGAAVPPTLLGMTVRAAALLASGQTIPSGLVRANVVTLSEALTRALTMTKLKAVALALLVSALAGAGAVALLRPTDSPALAAGEQPVPPEPKKAAPPAGAGAWQERAVLKGVNNQVSAMAFSPDGKTLATESGGREVTLDLWDAATGKHKTTLRPPHRRHRLVGFAADGRVVTASTDGAFVILWDAATGKDEPGIRTDGVVALSPDGKTLAIGGTAGTVRLWGVAAGKEQATLRGGADRVLALAFSADGKTLTTASGGEVRLWDVATAKERGALKSAKGEA